MLVFSKITDMFAKHLRHLYRTCDKIIIRNLRNRKNWYETSRPNPGLDNRISAFKKDHIKITDDDVEEFVEQSYSDFYKVGEAYDKHLNETLISKNDVRHQIVKDKYFKENMPNLLTWSEKDQIRHLVTTEPSEWTIQRITESFPVTEPVVKKLLKYPWKPASEQRIARHDASVMRNWRELKEGTLNIPEELRQHFLKFSERNLPPLSKSAIKIDITPEDKVGEFESIVRRCADNENSKGTTDLSDLDVSESQPKKIDKKDPRRMTLEELSAKIQRRLQTGKNVDMADQIIFDSVNDTTLNKSPDNFNNEMEPFNDKKEHALTEHKQHVDEKDVMAYPERIRIPRKAYKKGATFKVNDCYYDHDGKFLYRVLGMIN